MKTYLACAVLLAFCGEAGAQTVDTFSFTDGGFAGSISPGDAGTLSGRFTGKVEANGTIQASDLSSFSLHYVSGGASLFGYGPASFFSFIPGNASTLDFAAPIGAGQTACVGAAAAFGAFGCGAGGVNGEVAGLDTTQGLPTVTLVSSFYVPPPTTPHATTAPGQPVPEPPSWTLVPAALGLLSVGRRVARARRCQQSDARDLPGSLCDA